MSKTVRIPEQAYNYLKNISDLTVGENLLQMIRVAMENEEILGKELSFRLNFMKDHFGEIKYQHNKVVMTTTAYNQMVRRIKKADMSYKENMLRDMNKGRAKADQYTIEDLRDIE